MIPHFQVPTREDEVRNVSALRQMVNNNAKGNLPGLADRVGLNTPWLHRTIRTGALASDALEALQPEAALFPPLESRSGPWIDPSDLTATEQTPVPSPRALFFVNPQSFDFNATPQPSLENLGQALRTMVTGIKSGHFSRAPDDVVVAWGTQLLSVPSRLASKSGPAATRWLNEVAKLPKEWTLGALAGANAAAYLASGQVDAGLETLVVSGSPPPEASWERIGVVVPEQVAVQPVGSHLKNETTIRAETPIYPEDPNFDPLSNPALHFEDQSIYLIQIDWLGVAVPAGHFGLLTPKADTLWPVFKLKTTRPRFAVLEDFVRDHKFWKHIAPFANTLPHEQRIAFLYIIELMIRGEFDRAAAERFAVGAKTKARGPSAGPTDSVGSTPEARGEVAPSPVVSKSADSAGDDDILIVDRSRYQFMKHGVLLSAKKFRGKPEMLQRLFQLLEKDPEFNYMLDHQGFQLRSGDDGDKKQSYTEQMEVDDDGHAVVTAVLNRVFWNDLSTAFTTLLAMLDRTAILSSDVARDGRTLLLRTNGGQLRTSFVLRSDVTSEELSQEFLITTVVADWVPKHIIMHVGQYSTGKGAIYFRGERVIDTKLETSFPRGSPEFAVLANELHQKLNGVLASAGSVPLTWNPDYIFDLDLSFTAQLQHSISLLPEDSSSSILTLYDTSPAFGRRLGLHRKNPFPLLIMEFKTGSGEKRSAPFLIIPGPNGDQLALGLGWEISRDRPLSDSKFHPIYLLYPLETPDQRTFSDSVLRRTKDLVSQPLPLSVALKYFDSDIVTGVVPGLQFITPVGYNADKTAIVRSIKSSAFTMNILETASLASGLNFGSNVFGVIPRTMGHSLLYQPDLNTLSKVLGGVGEDMGPEEFSETLFHEGLHYVFFTFSEDYRAFLYEHFRKQRFFQVALGYLEADSVHFNKKAYEERFATEALSVWGELFLMAMRQSPENPRPFHVRKPPQEQATREILARAVEMLQQGEVSKTAWNRQVRDLLFWQNLPHLKEHEVDATYDLLLQQDPQAILNDPIAMPPELEYVVQPREMFLAADGLPPFVRKVLEKHGYSVSVGEWKSDEDAKEVWLELLSEEKELRRSLLESINDQ